MTFFRLLQGIGDRLGILEVVSTPDSAHAARVIQTRTISLRELSMEIRSGEVRVLADSPVELSIPFEKIFEAAGISRNPDDWTILRLGQAVAEESAKQKPREEIQKTILERLNSEKVPVENIVKDAVARDQALDAFENVTGEKMQRRREDCAKRVQWIEQQIRDLRRESAQLEENLKTEEEKWREWRKLKRAYEKEMASAASYIVDHQVITTDDENSA